MLRYRPMNQALSFEGREMERSGDRFVGSVPAEALRGEYALAYAFIVHDARGVAWRHPGLGEDLAQQPYFVARPTGGGSLQRAGMAPMKNGPVDWVYGRTWERYHSADRGSATAGPKGVNVRDRSIGEGGSAGRARRLV